MHSGLYCDQNVDASDVDTFLSQFGRNPFNSPCPDCYDSPCPCTPAGTPKTGQATSYATGDDGNLEKGVAWPNPRFTDNGDGTVTDNLTNLVWLKNANCFGREQWWQALSYSNGLASGSSGLTDGSQAGGWRLPNYKELFSLVDAANYDPALPTGHPFNNVQFFYYWSSTTDPSFTILFAFHVMMYDGVVNRYDKNLHDYVWPVRDPL